ncbi:hypothetical protein I12421_09280 [Campylobacter lari]|uniref:hypothetical protein n=1 Tax=Campylobacter lari TaxID=201 RepID=UPI002581E468|nr:hypothetical protein [Campylobacter lari]GMM10551.1 hypothetical protein I12421_09280 [Campylobacter lari]
MSNKQKIYLCSFADTRLGISVCRFKQQAEAMNVFDDIFLYSEASLPLDFKEYFKSKMYTHHGAVSCRPNSGPSLNTQGLAPSRGFGYWCWKPKVILMALEQIKFGDMLLYLDIGVEFNITKRNLLLEMLKQANINGIMGLIHEAPNKLYQKGDTLRYFGLDKDDDFLNSWQPVSGVIFIKKTEKNYKIIQEWMKVFYEHWEFVDDETPSSIVNPYFVRNLHDQSIWSILCKKYNIQSFPIEYYTDRKNKALLYNRNKTYLSNDIKKVELFNNIIRNNGHDNIHIEDFLLRHQNMVLNNKNINEENTSLKTKIESLLQENDKIKKENKKYKEFADSLITKKRELEIMILNKDLIYKELQIKEMQQKLKLNTSFIYIDDNNSAKNRIKNHLSYKLGQAIINNSKSLFGYIRIPFVLSYIKDKHKQEQKIYQEKIKKDPSFKLPPLENYSDYREALKVKESFAYRLGSICIKSYKNWYMGGLFSMIFEVYKLKRNFKKKK